MKQFKKRKLIVLGCIFSMLLYSCTKETDRIIGVEIDGTSTLNGTYFIDDTYTKGPKYIHTEDSSKRLITYDDEGKSMWGLMNKNYLVYKIEKSSEIPPEEQWECGVGVDKDKFRCFAIYSN